MKITTKDITLMALMSVTIVLQEQALNFIPNFSLTHLFIAICFELLGLGKALIIVLVYGLLDNLLMGSLGSIYGPFTILFWCLYPILIYLFGKIFKKMRLKSSIAGAVHALVYSWGFALVFLIFYQMPLDAYLLADIPWEITLTLTAFLTNFLLLPALSKRIKKVVEFY